MAEKLSLELELLDHVSGTAKKATDALKAVEAQAKKANDQLERPAKRRQGEELRRLANLQVAAGREDTARAQRALANTRKLALAQLDAHKMNKKFDEERAKAAKHHGGGFMGSFKHALPFRSVGDYFKGAFWGHLAAEGVEKIFQGFEHGAHAAVHIITHGLEHAFRAIGKEQERVAGYDLSLGKHGSHEAREDIERFAKKTAFSPSQNMDMMLPIFRAGMKGQDARTTYAAALDLAAGRGKGSDQVAVSEAVELFAKIQQKGGVTSKQLAGVGLGETNLPAFYKDLGKYLHISAKEAEKRASQPGGVDPRILRNTLIMAIEKQQGGQAGTGAERAGGSLFGMWNKLKELPEDFFEKLVNSPAIPKLTAVVAGILEKFDPNGPTGQKIFAALEGAFNKLGEWVEATFTEKNIDGFLEALKKVPEYLDMALKIGEALAMIFIGGKLVNAISAAITGVSVVSAPMLAAGAGIAAIAIAFQQISAAVDKLGGLAAVKRDLGEFLTTGGMMNAPATSRGNAGYEAYEEEQKRNLERAHARQRNVSNKVDVGGITIVAAPGEDPTHTHQRAAENVTRHLSNGLERAAAEGG